MEWMKNVRNDREEAGKRRNRREFEIFSANLVCKAWLPVIKRNAA